MNWKELFEEFEKNLLSRKFLFVIIFSLITSFVFPLNLLNIFSGILILAPIVIPSISLIVISIFKSFVIIKTKHGNFWSQITPVKYLKYLILLLLLGIVSFGFLGNYMSSQYVGEETNTINSGKVQGLMNSNFPTDFSFSDVPPSIIEDSIDAGLPKLSFVSIFADFCLLSQRLCVKYFPFHLVYIPILLVLLFLLFSQQEILLNNSSLLGSFRRSAFLVRNNFIDVALLWIFSALILIGINAIFNLPLEMIELSAASSFMGVVIGNVFAFILNGFRRVISLALILTLETTFYLRAREDF